MRTADIARRYSAMAFAAVVGPIPAAERRMNCADDMIREKAIALQSRQK
jgi:hypothetical protein